MAEKQPNTQPQNPTVTDTTTANGNQDKAIDLKSLTAEQLAEVYENPELFKHPRFKELAQAKQELKKLQDERAKAEDEKLKEQQEWQKLAEKHEKAAQKLKQQLQDREVEYQISEKARALGAVDPSAVLKLIDKGKITTNEDGTVTGVEEAVKGLLEEKKYLVGKPYTPNLGGDTNPGTETSGQMRFKASQLQDHEFFMKYEKEIGRAQTLGLIEDDLPSA